MTRTRSPLAVVPPRGSRSKKTDALISQVREVALMRGRERGIGEEAVLALEQRRDHAYTLVLTGPEGSARGAVSIVPLDPGSLQACSSVWAATNRATEEPGPRQGVEAFAKQHSANGGRLAEVCGWCVVPGTPGGGGATLALGCYALSRLLGRRHSIATVRHGMHQLLLRMGAFPLHDDQGRPVPPFFDPVVKSREELLGFDAYAVAPAFEGRVLRIQSAILNLAASWPC